MKRFALFIAAMLLCGNVYGQAGQVRAPDCVLGAGQLVLSAVGTSQLYDNRGSGCVDWTLTYSTYGFTPTIQVVSAPNVNGAGTPVAFAGNVYGVTQPITASSSGTVAVSGYYPWMGVAMTAKSGTGSFQGTLYGWRAGPSVSGITATSTAFTPTLGATVFAVDAAPGALYGISAFNPHTAVCYIQIFDAAAASVSLGTTVPKVVIPVSTIDDVNMTPTTQALYNFATAISAASTTTSTGSTTCTAANSVTFYFK